MPIPIRKQSHSSLKDRRRSKKIKKGLNLLRKKRATRKISNKINRDIREREANRFKFVQKAFNRNQTYKLR